jgi:hypothetical protein
MAVTPGHLGTLRLTVSNNFCRYTLRMYSPYYFKILKYAYVAVQAVHFISLLVKYTGPIQRLNGRDGKIENHTPQ